MKGIVSIFAFLLSILFAASAFAVEAGKTGEAKEKAATGESMKLTGEHQVVSIHQLLGKKIQNQQGEELGEIHNILVDPGTGQIAYVMVNTGESLAAELKAVPFNALEIAADTIHLNIDKEKLASAPMWSEEQSVEEFSRQSSEFFGVSPYWEESETGIEKEIEKEL